MTSSCCIIRCVVIASLLLTSSQGRSRHQHGNRGAMFTVNEQLPVGHVVGSIADVVTSQDGDDVGRKYSLLGDRSRELFRVDEVTGTIQTAAVLDRELCPDMTLTTRSRSCIIDLDVAILPRFDVIMVSIEVTDINDNSPTFSVNWTTQHVLESAPIGPIFQLPAATDRDSGDNGNVKYRLEPNTFPFRLRVSEGASESGLTVELTQQLDRETTSGYNLTLTAYDAGIPALSTSLSVSVVIDDVNDNIPQFDAPVYDVTIAPSAAVGAWVASVTAYDMDIGRNAEIRYRFATKTQARYGRMFSLDSESGNITTADVLDFSRSPVIRLVVLATDLGDNPLSRSTTVTVRAAAVNEHLPTVSVEAAHSSDRDADPRHLTLPENSPVNTFIAHVVVRDADVGQEGLVECWIQPNVDDDSQYFDLVPLNPAGRTSANTGMEYKLVSGAVFDREVRSVYRVSLLCRDHGEPSYSVERALVVQVTDIDDNAPRFWATSYNFTVAENNAVGQVIGRVSASDADTGPNGVVAYSLGSDIEWSSWFAVDRSTGEIRALVSFDREFVDEFNFHVMATSSVTSNSSSSNSGHVTVHVTVTDVDDNIARFESSWYRFEVPENQPSGTVIGRVSAVDPDLPPFNSFFYSFDARTGASQDHLEISAFVIEPVTGVIYTRRPLDREQLSHYTLRVRAYTDVISASDDAMDASDVTAVFVAVGDVNDNIPEVKSPEMTSSGGAGSELRQRRESVQPGAVVARLVAKDADIGDNARLAYSIIAGNEKDLFAIDQVRGVITWSEMVSDNITLAECPWALTVKVTDQGKVKQLWTTTTLTVDLDDCVSDDQTAAARLSNMRHVGQFKLLMADWHVFVVAVTIATCVVIFGTLLTAVVAVRYCNRRRRRSKPSTPAPSGPAEQGDGESIGMEDHEIRLKLMTAQSDPTSSHESVVSADQVLVVVKSQQEISKAVIRAIQQQLQVSSLPVSC